MTEVNGSLRSVIIQMTWDSLKSIEHLRLYRNERGFQGALLTALHKRLGDNFPEGTIVEEEYAKSLKRHGTNQRPDIILHIPSEHSGLGPKEGNFAVYALKRNAHSEDAIDDFNKLKDMFRLMRYPLGFFVNIDSDEHCLEHYSGQYKNRIHCFTVILDNGLPVVKHAYFRNSRIIEEINLGR